MRARDGVIIAVALLCSIICWYQEGALHFQRAFSIHLQGTELQSYIMPKPVVIDPDGDGNPILLATTDFGMLARYETRYSRRRIDDIFTRLEPFRLLPVMERIVGIGAGFVDINCTKTIAVVVTQRYQVVGVQIQQKKLDVMWSTNLLPGGALELPAHAAVSVVPNRVNTGDEGIVSVAVPVRDDNDVPMTMFVALNARDGSTRWRFLSDAANEMDDVVREVKRADDVSPLDPGADFLRLAMGENDRNMAAAASVKGTPQIGRRYEQPWTSYREAVAAALPHHYAHPWDAQLRPHVLFKAKAKGTKSRLQAAAASSTRRKILRYAGRIIRMDTDEYGTLGTAFSNWANSLRDKTSGYVKPVVRRPKPANTFVYHGKKGIEIVHMYTGNMVTHVLPLRNTDTYYHDINDDLMIESVEVVIGAVTKTGDEKHDIRTVYDCVGRIETGVPTTEDNIFDAGICDTKGFFGNLDLLHRFVDGDVRGEASPRSLNTLELLGSRNIASPETRAAPPLVVQVQNNLGGGVHEIARYAAFLINTGLITCVDPARKRVLWRAQTGATFSAEVEERGAEARVVEDEDEESVRPFPHMVGYSLGQRNIEDDVTYVGGGSRVYRHMDSYLLAFGEKELVVLHTKNGKISRSIPLPDTPVAPAMVVDFNGDGTNDIIIVTKDAIFGFVGNSQASSETIAALMVLLLSLLAILFIAREKGILDGAGEDEFMLPTQSVETSQRPRKFKRSTD